MKASGRGTNRAIGMCAKPGAPPPVFEKKQRLLVVTFKSPLVVGGGQGVTRDPATWPAAPTPAAMGTRWGGNCWLSEKRLEYRAV